MQKRRKKTSKEERICAICSQGFSKAEHLSRHIRSHTKERPFRCLVCDKVYARQFERERDTLLRHSRSHHPKNSVAAGLQSPSVVGDDSAASSLASRPGFSDTATTDYNSGMATLGMTPHDDRQPIEHDEAARIPLSNSVDSGGQLDSVVASTSPMNTCLGTDLSTTTTLTMPSLGEDGVRQCDLMPYWNLEHDPQWSFGSFFPGTDIDFDALDMTFLNDLGRQPILQPLQHIAPTAEEAIRSRSTLEPDIDVNSLTRSYSLIQRGWHTFCGHRSSGYTSPALSEAHYHVDELCRSNLRDRLQPRPQLDSLPSTSFLDLCVQAYFANFHPIFPIIHAASFRPHAENGLLLLSICSTGSLFLGSARATAHGISMYERLNKSILSSWDSFVTNLGPSSQIAFQASVIGQMFGLLLGRPKDLLQVELFHGTMVVWARKTKSTQLKNHDIDNLMELSGQELDATWKKWARNEEKRRTLLGLLLQDAEISRQYYHEPVIQDRLDQLPRTASREAFSARDATTWKMIMMNQASSGLVDHSQAESNHSMSANSPTFSSFPDIHNEFELCVMLERIGTMASESRRPDSPQPQTSQPCQEMLISWYDKYHKTIQFQKQSPSLLILWHSIFMLTYMDLDILECAAGREGYGIAQSHYQEARSWASSPQAQKCIVHAILLQRQFEQIALGSEPPIHSPICLYRCGIAWHCYTLFREGNDPVIQGEVDMPELRVLGVDGNQVMLNEIGSLIGRSREKFALKIVDLLRRISHWKVADSFASTLLVLVEESQNLF